jgi:hypothetical protein
MKRQEHIFTGLRLGYLISKLYLSGKAILSIDAVEDSEVLLFPF